MHSRILDTRESDTLYRPISGEGDRPFFVFRRKRANITRRGKDLLAEILPKLFLDTGFLRLNSGLGLLAVARSAARI